MFFTLFCSYHQGLRVGLNLALAIALHNIPEGVAISLPLYFAIQRYHIMFKVYQLHVVVWVLYCHKGVPYLECHHHYLTFSVVLFCASPHTAILCTSTRAPSYFRPLIHCTFLFSRV
ncbi:hypothetical protein RND81_01G180300 [Saponaria officinalis]|uniref:Uncharacterized protein n=1 Tax=Saponaria officinalis TaxID=3572 RepID=A0AAW1NJF6_SAPOF